MPDAQRHPRMLEEMVRGLSSSCSHDAEDVTFTLAEEDQRLYRNHQWRETALRFGTISAARRLVDLTVNGALDGKSYDGWRWQRERSDERSVGKACVSTCRSRWSPYQ